jgi:hypothetical protein
VAYCGLGDLFLLEIRRIVHVLTLLHAIRGLGAILVADLAGVSNKNLWKILVITNSNNIIEVCIIILVQIF